MRPAASALEPSHGAAKYAAILSFRRLARFILAAVALWMWVALNFSARCAKIQNARQADACCSDWPTCTSDTKSNVQMR